MYEYQLRLNNLSNCPRLQTMSSLLFSLDSVRGAVTRAASVSGNQRERRGSFCHVRGHFRFLLVLHERI